MDLPQRTVQIQRPTDPLVDELAEGNIAHTVQISQTVPISTSIVVNEQIPVPVSLVVSNTLPVNTEIPFQETVLVPVDLEIDQLLAIDTTIPFKEELVVPIDDVIPIDEKFEIRVLGQDIQVPIRGDIPVFDDALRAVVQPIGIAGRQVAGGLDVKIGHPAETLRAGVGEGAEAVNDIAVGVCLDI